MNLGLGMPQDAIVPDRAFNTRESTDAFLGYRGAVESVEYDPRWAGGRAGGWAGWWRVGSGRAGGRVGWLVAGGQRAGGWAGGLAGWLAGWLAGRP